MTIESDATVADSVERVKNVIGEKEALGLMAEIDHETNLPALNASIEAARAGEAGEGLFGTAREG